MTTEYGSDLSCYDDITQNAKVLSSTDPLVVVQAIYRRLVSPKGCLITDADYGLGLVELLSRGITRSSASIIPALIKSEIMKDDRVDSCDVSATISSDGSSVRFKASLTLDENTFDLVLVGSTAGVILEQIK